MHLKELEIFHLLVHLQNGCNSTKARSQELQLVSHVSVIFFGVVWGSVVREVMKSITSLKKEDKSRICG